MIASTIKTSAGVLLCFCALHCYQDRFLFFCVLFWRAPPGSGAVWECHRAAIVNALIAAFQRGTQLQRFERAKLRRFRYLSAPLSACAGSHRLCGELEPWLAALCGRSACCWRCCCRWKVRLCPAHHRRSTCSAFCAALRLWGRITGGRPAWQQQTHRCIYHIPTPNFPFQSLQMYMFDFWFIFDLLIYFELDSVMMPPFALGPHINWCWCQPAVTGSSHPFQQDWFLMGVFQAAPVLLNNDIYRRSEWCGTTHSSLSLSGSTAACAMLKMMSLPLMVNIESLVPWRWIMIYITVAHVFVYLLLPPPRHPAAETPSWHFNALHKGCFFPPKGQRDNPVEWRHGQTGKAAGTEKMVHPSSGRPANATPHTNEIQIMRINFRLPVGFGHVIFFLTCSCQVDCIHI